MVKEILQMGMVILHLSGSYAFAKKGNHYNILMDRWQNPSFNIGEAVNKQDWTF